MFVSSCTNHTCMRFCRESFEDFADSFEGGSIWDQKKKKKKKTGFFLQTDLALSFARVVENNINERGLGFRVPRHAEPLEDPDLFEGTRADWFKGAGRELVFYQILVLFLLPRLSKYNLKCQCPLEQWTKEAEAERTLTKTMQKEHQNNEGTHSVWYDINSSTAAMLVFSQSSRNLLLAMLNQCLRMSDWFPWRICTKQKPCTTAIQKHEMADLKYT